ESLVSKIQKQEEDLAGCRAIHDGKGGATSLVQCMEFFNREERLGLKSIGRETVISDLNTLCRKFAPQAAFQEKIIKSHTLARSRSWTPCREVIWKEIYLATYAHLDSDPIAAVSLVRRAQAAIPNDSVWAGKAIHLIRK